jgi:hypothetical protein
MTTSDTAAQDETQRLLADLPEIATPPIGKKLSEQLEAMQPVSTRHPQRELLLFVGISLPFFAFLLFMLGTRRDLSALSAPWIGSVALVWLASYAASAYLGFIPAKGHVAPRSRSSRQVLIASSVVLVALGLFATQTIDGVSSTYPSTLSNFVAHAGGCAIMGFGSGVIPGIIALILMRRFVPVGRTSIGLSLGAAGGSLAGLTLLLYCPIAERFHVGLVHGTAIVTAAIFVAGASQMLLRERG